MFFFSDLQLSDLLIQREDMLLQITNPLLLQSHLSAQVFACCKLHQHRQQNTECH
ncbi:Uncharacterised protein [Vibrio cholerae]|nr:Uncharacterised protein [Vibrio cholerae]CSD15248.1 Uncharacterised protein [Vibrio cholerae]CSI58755.1 Uncharacterised protein [Vibrio cholerae]